MATEQWEARSPEVRYTHDLNQLRRELVKAQLRGLVTYLMENPAYTVELAVEALHAFTAEVGYEDARKRDPLEPKIIPRTDVDTQAIDKNALTQLLDKTSDKIDNATRLDIRRLHGNA